MFYIMILNIPLYQGKASKNEQDKKKTKKKGIQDTI